MRATYFVRDIDGNVITVETYDESDSVYLSVYEDGEGRAEYRACETPLTKEEARALGRRLLLAADKMEGL